VVEEIDRLSPAPGKIRISVRASGVNFADELIVAGKYQFTPPFPFSLSFEVSGVIAEPAEKPRISVSVTG
jgi:NADPH2:quinone reductase